MKWTNKNLPFWNKCELKWINGKDTPLDLFIYNHQPTRFTSDKKTYFRDKKKFRDELIDMLNFIDSTKKL